ncbi:hypothetical protein K488DRAFT_86343 [Vararia minispora EC-137]|uniref:Uncharacterized protein n=1 Tax=Vararia minispora EC-137 TaxID=1314806 RepID=A0ACB8QJK5_9AGAM|nr:hypothetical protein K488DRAFT_86343 [Vararia minispora EC-137]
MLSDRHGFCTPTLSKRSSTGVPFTFAVAMHNESYSGDLEPPQSTKGRIRPTLFSVTDYDFQLCESQSPCPEPDGPPVSPSQTFPHSPDILTPLTPYSTFSKRSEFKHESLSKEIDLKELPMLSSKHTYGGFLGESASSSQSSLASLVPRPVEVFIFPKLHNAQPGVGELHSQLSSKGRSVSPELPELSLGSTLAVSLSLTLSCDHLSDDPQTSFPASPMTPSDVTVPRSSPRFASSDVTSMAGVDTPASPVTTQVDRPVSSAAVGGSSSVITTVSPSSGSQRGSGFQASSPPVMQSPHIALASFGSNRTPPPPIHFYDMSISSSPTAASPAVPLPTIGHASAPLPTGLPPAYVAQKVMGTHAPRSDAPPLATSIPSSVLSEVPAHMTSKPCPMALEPTTMAHIIASMVHPPDHVVWAPASMAPVIPSATVTETIANTSMVAANFQPMAMATPPPRTTSLSQLAAPSAPPPMQSPLAQSSTAAVIFPQATLPRLMASTAPIQPPKQSETVQKKGLRSLLRKPSVRLHAAAAATSDPLTALNTSTMDSEASVPRTSDEVSMSADSSAMTMSDRMGDGAGQSAMAEGEGATMLDGGGVALSRSDTTNTASSATSTPPTKTGILRRLRSQLSRSKHAQGSTDGMDSTNCAACSSNEPCDQCLDEQSKPWKAFLYKLLTKKLSQPLSPDASPAAVMAAADAMLADPAMAAIVREAMQQHPLMTAAPQGARMEAQNSTARSEAPAMSAPVSASPQTDSQSMMAMAQQLASMALAMSEDPSTKVVLSVPAVSSPVGTQPLETTSATRIQMSTIPVVQMAHKVEDNSTPTSPLTPTDTESPVEVTAAPPSLWQPMVPATRRPPSHATKFRSLHNAPSTPPPPPPVH